MTSEHPEAQIRETVDAVAEELEALNSGGSLLERMMAAKV